MIKLLSALECVLAHYRPEFKTMLTVDAGPRGAPCFRSARPTASTYNFIIEYVSSSSDVANYLSLAAAVETGAGVDGAPAYVHYISEALAPLHADDVRRETARDSVFLKTLRNTVFRMTMRYVVNGWPKKMSDP
ncbi:hypothetical protein EVAR_44650_1 [Eumeta japonica]|uniref:Uncharacterized protein n=1 Tax=Eumeta variegata TaxID=151549 RepID=A0A4C1XGW4_EUMVA|nr:hypothetical protein EVAR_44650_1 [Eumeta japonica]